MFEKYRRNLLCRHRDEVIMPKLIPSSIMSQIFLYGIQLEPDKDRYITVKPKKALNLAGAIRVLSWFNMRVNKDVFIYPPPPPYAEYEGCDPMRNTALLYLFPKYNLTTPEGRLLIPEYDYITSVEELIKAIKKVVRNRKAKIYVLSKYARPGNVSYFIKKLTASQLTIYIASEEGNTWRGIPRQENHNVNIVYTRSHRKLMLIIIEDEEPTLVAYKGSMNIFFPGYDDYLEAVNDWSDMRRLLHGLVRAFLVV